MVIICVFWTSIGWNPPVQNPPQAQPPLMAMAPAFPQPLQPQPCPQQQFMGFQPPQTHQQQPYVNGFAPQFRRCQVPSPPRSLSQAVWAMIDIPSWVLLSLQKCKTLHFLSKSRPIHLTSLPWVSQCHLHHLTISITYPSPSPIHLHHLSISITYPSPSPSFAIEPSNISSTPATKKQPSPEQFDPWGSFDK